MKGLSKGSATSLQVGDEGDGQRIDNYLTRLLKGVPKSHIYRILRSGEVRVNSRRTAPDHRLNRGDKIRLPPVRSIPRTAPVPGITPKLEKCVIYEDDELLVLDKPAGFAVHGGSGVRLGVIEQLRGERPQLPYLELAHRLDRDTSGVLVLAKKRSALLSLHEQFRSGKARKFYLTLVRGRWRNTKQVVKLPLRRLTTRTGDRRVQVDDEGQEAHTVFRLQWTRRELSLLEAELKTGRTHQIRVHLAHLGYPVLGDEKYGDFALNKELARQGLKRMFLHAARLVIRHPASGKELDLRAPVPVELDAFVAQLEPQRAAL